MSFRKVMSDDSSSLGLHKSASPESASSPSSSNLTGTMLGMLSCWVVFFLRVRVLFFHDLSLIYSQNQCTVESVLHRQTTGQARRVHNLICYLYMCIDLDKCNTMYLILNVIPDTECIQTSPSRKIIILDHILWYKTFYLIGLCFIFHFETTWLVFGKFLVFQWAPKLPLVRGCLKNIHH